MSIVDPFSDEEPRIPSEAEYLDKVFGPGGYLAASFPGYKARPGQIMFTKAVDDAIIFNECAVCECPTGTGKSISYCVPISYYCSLKNYKAVIVTANLSLQDQLIKKDLPMLREILPWSFTFEPYKGTNNYPCLDKWIKGEQDGYKDFRGTYNDKDELNSLRQWIEELNSDPNSVGDVAELEFVPSPTAWRELSVSGDECKGKDCKQYDRCYAVKAHKAARDADIIVTNYAVLSLHVKLKQETGQDLLLPEHQILVADEAHEFADACRDHLGHRVTAEAFRRAANGLRGSIHSSLVEKNAYAVFDEIKRYRQSKNYKTRLKEELVKFSYIGEQFKTLKNTVMLLHQEYTEHIAEKKADVVNISNKHGDDDLNVMDLKVSLQQLEKRDRRLMELLEELENALTLTDKDKQVYFIEIEGKAEYAVVKSKPISVAETLQYALFKKTPTVVLTSATISTNGNFDFIAGELGLTSYSSLIAESPFDWPSQALVVLPDSMPSPTDRDAFPTAVAEHFARVVEAADGRTLGLFTSWRVLEKAWELVKDHPRYTMLRQGQGGSRTKLVERFKRDKHSVLLGTESFWAGVDVPGEALSCVCIDRLPFVSPDDPIADAISEADPKGFFRNYSIPRAIIALKQGFGRLIRSTSDVGCVVILDRRIRTERYGGLFLRSLPPARCTSSIEDITKFLNGKAKPALLPSSHEESEEEFFKRAFG